MRIKQYDYYEFGYNGSSGFIDFRYEDNENLPFCITNLFHEIYPYKWAIWYKDLILQSEVFTKIGIFPGVEVTFDQKNNLIYISDAYEDDYRIRMKNVTAETILQFCHNGKLNYSVMTYKNFIALIDLWATLLEYEPKFALLYQDEKDWYDLIPFETQESMEQFVTNHIFRQNE